MGLLVYFQALTKRWSDGMASENFKIWRGILKMEGYHNY